MNTENFGKVEIIDNWVDEDLINHLSNQFLYRYPLFFVERSTPEGKPYMYSHDCRQSMDAQGDQGNQTLIAFIETKIKKRLKSKYGKLNTSRTYFNVQHPGMEGSYHVDDGNITGIYMVTKTLSKSGQLLIDGEKDVPFVQGRFVMFNAKTSHKATSPSKGNVRISLAFKTE